MNRNDRLKRAKQTDPSLLLILHAVPRRYLRKPLLPPTICFFPPQNIKISVTEFNLDGPSSQTVLGHLTEAKENIYYNIAQLALSTFLGQGNNIDINNYAETRVGCLIACTRKEKQKD